MTEWKGVSLDNAQYLFKIDKSETDIKFLLHDTKILYIEQLTAQQFKEKCDRLNPEIEDLDQDEMLAEILDYFTNSTDILKNVHLSEEKFDVNISWDSDGLPLSWLFQFRIATADEFYENVTSNLVKIIEVLLCRQKDLFKIIRDKDIELGEFKNSGLKVTRPHLQTEWFEPDKYLDAASLPNLDTRSPMQILLSPELPRIGDQKNGASNDKKTDGNEAILKPSYLKVKKRGVKPSKPKVDVPEYKPNIHKRKVASENVEENKKKALIKKKLQKL